MKVKAKVNTNNIKRCVFCRNWEGDEFPEYVGNNIYAYDQNVWGICRALHDMRKKANDTCHTNNMDIYSIYLKK